jgi:hypothetical protein
MTVAMSDADYAVLVEAAGWIRQHSGIDAPDYPRLERLVEVVDSIARRRQQPLEDFPSVEPPEGATPGLHLLPPPPKDDTPEDDIPEDDNP